MQPLTAGKQSGHRRASLDLGSNTLRLLVAEVGHGGWRAVERALATPRLGRGLTPGAPFTPPAREAARRLTGEFTARARELGARRVVLAATQAARLAVDGPELVADLAREFLLDRAVILSGEEEAGLSRLGVKSRLTGPAAGALLADVGGGSSEIIPLTEGGGRSLPLGAVALSEVWLRSDPPRSEELTALRQAVQEGLASLVHLKAPRLVATAGTAATLAAMSLGLTSYEPERVNNHVVTRARLSELYNQLSRLPLAQRREFPGLEPERADVILGGLAILAGLLDFLHLDRLTTMDAGLLEGILLDDVAKAEAEGKE
ncbi:MAG: hypothetical protein KQJ78_13550 [Deltaproteobacteria bacterium]|nr:hypothetical protein [Deltaproteobacteria bacterium]